MEIAQDNASLATTKIFLTATWKTGSKFCDYCKSAPAVLYCRTDSAFMCISCDDKSHSNTYPHKRVWICEVCEQAPAVVTCKADAATLCESCDRDIHSVNPLARRHERVPVVPFYDTAQSVLMKSTGPTMFITDPTTPSEQEISDSWISGNSKFSEDVMGLKSMEFLETEQDQFLDFEACQVPDQTYNDSIVPVVHTTFKPQAGFGPVAYNHDQFSDNQFELEFMKSNLCSFNKNYSTPTVRHSVSSTLLDVGVVPDNGGSFSDKMYLVRRNTVEPDEKQATGVVGLDRVARVLRYREKRKNRKFEKTIRYASRKAYAESRPRIKGRFAKRTDSETDLNQFIDSGVSRFVVDAGYGVVPSF